MIDLEQAIMVAWQTSEDLNLFYRTHGDRPDPMTEDEVSNMIYGIKQMHDMRMEQLFDIYKQTYKLDEYTTDPEVLAKRDKLLAAIDKLNTPKKKKK
jgi:alkylhydroperoxidase/carboxymuconolactone decarboxylase family protein YurZ